MYLIIRNMKTYVKYYVIQLFNLYFNTYSTYSFIISKYVCTSYFFFKCNLDAFNLNKNSGDTQIFYEITISRTGICHRNTNL